MNDVPERFLHLKTHRKKYNVLCYLDQLIVNCLFYLNHIFQIKVINCEG